jgi:hypothetical protein
VLNVLLCARVHLGLRAQNLDGIFQGMRSDYESADWAFLHPDDLPRELVHPTRRYHATSVYRMLTVFLHREAHLATARGLSPDRPHTQGEWCAGGPT